MDLFTQEIRSLTIAAGAWTALRKAPDHARILNRRKGLSKPILPKQPPSVRFRTKVFI